MIAKQPKVTNWIRGRSRKVCCRCCKMKQVYIHKLPEKQDNGKQVFVDNIPPAIEDPREGRSFTKRYPLAMQPLEVAVTTYIVAAHGMVVSRDVHDVVNNFEAVDVEQPTCQFGSNGQSNETSRMISIYFTR